MALADSKSEDRYLRALAIRDGHAVGTSLPILRHLALRGHAEAMIDLAGQPTASKRRATIGRAANPRSAAGLCRRAWRQGNARAAQNLAMACFNADDLHGYRLWLGRAARLGDAVAAAELAYFETRLPYDAARPIGRHRPLQRRDLL